MVWQDFSAVDSRCASRSRNPVNVEESTSSYNSLSVKTATPSGKVFRSLSNDDVVFVSDFAASGSKCGNDVCEDLTQKHNTFHCKLHNSDNDNKVSATCTTCVQ